jgi:UDP-3-O-acyl-N-acetylglucosamine deacetylase
MTFQPAQEGTGIVFLRNGKRVNATLANIRDGSNMKNGFLGWSATEFKQNGKSVSTSEHLMAALRAAGIDNCEIELSGKHIPQFRYSTREYMRELTHNKSQQNAKRAQVEINFLSTSRFVKRTPAQLEQVQTALARRKIPASFFSLAKNEPLIVFENPNPRRPDLLIIRPAKGVIVSSGYGFDKYKAIANTQFHRMQLDTKNYEQEVMDARVPAFPGILNGRLVNPFLTLGKVQVGDFKLHGIDSERAVLVGHPNEKSFLNDPKNPQTRVRYNGEEPVRHKQIDLLGVIASFPGHFNNVEIFAYKAGHEFLIHSFKQLVKEGIIVE